jgi:uncharacterized membrane protein
LYEHIKTLLSDHLRATNLFVITALFFGLIFVLTTPLLWGADETTQFGRAYQISQGHSIPEGFGTFHGGGYGGMIPNSYLNLIEYVNADITHPKLNTYGIGDVNNYKGYAQYADQKVSKTTTAYVFSNTAPYSPVAYIPSALGLRVASILGLDVGHSIYIARLFDLGFFVVIIWFALRSLRGLKTKWIIFTVALLPMTLFQASMITADDMTNAVCLLFIALVARTLLLKKELQTIEKIALCLSAALIPVLKPTYLPLILLLLIVPAYSFGKNIVTARIFKIVTYIVGLSIFGVWSYDTRNIADAVRLVVPGPVWSTINPTQQEHYLVRHGPSYIITMFRTILLNDNTYFDQMFGLLGFNYVQIPAISIVASSIGLIASFLISDNPKNVITRKRIIGILVIVLATLLLMLTTFYVTITTVGYGIIGGLQGRYFIPLVAPLMLGLLLLLPNVRLWTKEKTSVLYRRSEVSIAVLIILSLVFAVIKYHYVTFG